MSKTLEKIIYNLPIFDDTESNKPCLEELAKELGIIYEPETIQENIAEKIVNYLSRSEKIKEEINSTLKEERKNLNLSKEYYDKNCKGWIEALEYVLSLIERTQNDNIV